MPNPFKGLVPGTSLTGNTAQVSQLLQPYPQFSGQGGVEIEGENFGSSYFNMLQVKLEKRFSNGVQFVANYQFSKLIEQRSFLNLSDPAPEKRIANEDRPHRLVISGVYELPFGRGKRFASSLGRVANVLVSSRSVNGIYTLTSGDPQDWGNVIYFGGDLDWNARSIDRVFDTSRFNANSKQQLEWNVRNFQSRFTSYREDWTNNFDVSVVKYFPITEKVKLEYRAEFFNAFNRAAFDGPSVNPVSSNFGRITRQRNLPRIVQMALKLRW